MSDSEDEDLKRAIALSLQESSPRLAGQSNIIDLVSDSDEGDDDLDAPVTTKSLKFPTTYAVPKAATEAVAQKPRKEELLREASGSDIEASPSVTKNMDSMQNYAGMLGLDRKAMEEERLKRQKHREGVQLSFVNNNKRQASISPPRVRREMHGGTATEDVDLRAQPISQPYEEKRRKTAHLPPDVLPRNQEQLLSASGIQYPDGVIKKTWVKGCPRLGDDIKIEEVLQKDDLKLAVLSAFQVEPEWVESKLDPKTNVIWVLQAKTDAEKQNIQSSAPRNYRFCFPSMEGNINCMHSKLQLLAYSTHLRIVVPSANLTSYDWGETGVMENVTFLIDLPRLPTGKAATELTYFAEELLFFASALGLDQTTLNSLRYFDWSRTSQIAFIHSIGGSHADPQIWKRTGYCGLGNAVQKLGLATDDALEIDFLAASIGSLTETFLASLYLAAQGDNGLVEYELRTGKSARNKALSETERELYDSLNNHFRIYFPSAETIAKSHGGTGCGGTICFQSKWYDSQSFPRHLMHDCKSHRLGILMHSKMMFVRGRAKNGNSNVAWAYVGSANLSESAWGRLVKDKTTKEPKLTLRNWECGVLIRSGDKMSTDRKEAEKGSLGMDVFSGYIPIPMQVPGDQYGHRRPWFFMDR
ncbi:uncharacterized protein RSE6_11139 [Rhynchosporium secalis]|uniref:PLD phosphodiesterase domain-containing protein n=1 Tax=Rhynchosporium secalis TaxID=38038 RepID=A0A1E1MM85_RHYSE|nr:uncharacterized protein RSE6_11139 [Rhynchosporium secalis]